MEQYTENVFLIDSLKLNSDLSCIYSRLPELVVLDDNNKEFTAGRIYDYTIKVLDPLCKISDDILFIKKVLGYEQVVTFYNASSFYK